MGSTVKLSSWLPGRATNPTGFVTRPHIHVMIPGGCISEDKTQWQSSHPSFFLPVKRLSQQFKIKLISLIRKAYDHESLYVPKICDDFCKLLDVLEKKPWVVHSQAADVKHNDPSSLVRYLSRYVAKSVVSDKRISRIDDNRIAIGYYDRKKKKPKQEIITEHECMKRLTYHVLPKGFKKVRCYGFLSNRYKSGMLSLCRMLIGQPLAEQQTIDKELLNDTAFLFWKYFHIDITLCPSCKVGHIEYIKAFPPGG